MPYKGSGQLVKLLKKENLFPKHKLGQNFLINEKILEKIINTAEIKKDDHILEIGPGLGILTEKLIKIAKHVTAIEKDKKLYEFLQKQFKNTKNLSLIHKDILKTAVPKSPYKVIANIPYYITSPIINHFLQNNAPYRPSILILMVQLEVAEKICAKVGEHNVLSLLTQVNAKPKLIKKVSRNNFYPTPKVDSAILSLQVRKKPLLQKYELFKSIIETAFKQKRKTLANSLAKYSKLNKETATKIILSAELNPMIRPQNLDFKDWENILNQIH